MSEDSSKDTEQRPIWQTDAFVVLVLVAFWPVGLFFMWKYAPWRKRVKAFLSFFFLISTIPLILIWGLIFGIKGYWFIKKSINPSIVNQSKIYNCSPINSEWGRCKNVKNNFSFEYPITWNYIDLEPEGIGFSPLKENIYDDFIISVSPYTWDTEENARDFVKGDDKIDKGQETIINGLYANKHYDAYSGDGIYANVDIVDKNTTYQFTCDPVETIENNKISLNNNELKAICDHMASSFTKE